MTGEMHSINQDGEDSNGESWPLHAAIAKAVGGELRPFDVYQGPYILVDSLDYQGAKRLWISTEDGVICQVWREDNEALSDPFWGEDIETAIAEARALLEVA